MIKDRFVKDSIILTLSNLTTGILGFMFSVILSRELGAEGMGLYGLVMPIYNLFICLICGGMVSAVSKVTAIFFSKNDFRNLNKSISTTLFFDFIWGLLVASLVFIASPFISSYIIKDSRTLYSIMIICPALLFVALSSILKGYFYGVSKVQIPAFIDIFEKGVRMAVLVSTISIFSLSKVDSTVMAAYIALCIGELISLILLYFFYKINKRSLAISYSKTEGRAQLIFDILAISFPLCLNGFLSTAISTVSTLIVPRRIVTAGFTYSDALSMIGKFTGMSLSIIFFPIIVVHSMSTILIPDLSQNLVKKDYFALENRIYNVINIAFLLGLCTAVICISIPESLGYLFFKRTDLGSYIKFAALAAPFTYPATTTYAILNGLGKQGILLRNSLIVSFEELIFLFILTGIGNINIYGYGITFIITSITTLLINIYEIKKHCYLGFNISESLISILLGVLLFFIITFFNRVISNSYFVLKNIFIISFSFFSFFMSMNFIKKNES